MIDIKKMTIQQQKGIENMRVDIRTYLGINKEEYSKMVFDIGIELSNQPVFKKEMIKIKLFWTYVDFFFLVHEGIFIDGIEQEKHYHSLFNKAERMELFLDKIIEKYDHRKDYIKELEKELLKTLKVPAQPRTPKSKNNQL